MGLHAVYELKNGWLAHIRRATSKWRDHDWWKISSEGWTIGGGTTLEAALRSAFLTVADRIVPGVRFFSDGALLEVVRKHETSEHTWWVKNVKEDVGLYAVDERSIRSRRAYGMEVPR